MDNFVNLFPTDLDKKELMEMVLMNEDLCLHKAIYPDGSCRDSFAYPEFKWTPQKKGIPMSFVAKCPICDYEYEECSARVERECERYNAKFHEGVA